MLQSLHRILLALTMAVALPALAQGDPPARVGRLAYFENQVDFRVDRSEQGGPATLNWPISSGAVLETGQRGRAEVWIGSTAYRLADDSEVEFPVVDDARVDVRVSGGSLAINVLDTLGLISTSFGQWQGVGKEQGGAGVELVDEANYRYLSLQFQDDVLIGATSLGWTEHVGVLRGLIQTRTRLGAWKDRLLADPTGFMAAYLGSAQKAA